MVLICTSTPGSRPWNMKGSKKMVAWHWQETMLYFVRRYCIGCYRGDRIDKLINLYFLLPKCFPSWNFCFRSNVCFQNQQEHWYNPFWHLNEGGFCFKDTEHRRWRSCSLLLGWCEERDAGFSLCWSGTLALKSLEIINHFSLHEGLGALLTPWDSLQWEFFFPELRAGKRRETFTSRDRVWLFSQVPWEVLERFTAGERHDQN